MAGTSWSLAKPVPFLTSYTVHLTSIECAQTIDGITSTVSHASFSPTRSSTRWTGGKWGHSLSPAKIPQLLTPR